MAEMYVAMVGVAKPLAAKKFQKTECVIHSIVTKVNLIIQAEGQEHNELIKVGALRPRRIGMLETST